jgi:allophanate hydrolase
MKASELETTNANNIPLLRFVVPYNRNTDAPIQTPSFVAHVSCPPPCPVYPDATGELLPSATPDDQRALFDLPLATETIPALASLLGPADVSISLTVADAAGNEVAVPGFNFKFHAIGPPLALGSVELADGSVVHGFLCEAPATAGALDISAFGGWRAWLASRTQPPTPE